MDALRNYYNDIINEISIKAVDVFNNSYNLNLNKDNILNGLTCDLVNEPPVKEMANLTISDTCIGIKRNKTNCRNKPIPGHVYCGTHIRLEGKIPLNEHIKNVASKFNYENTANVVSLGNAWLTQDNQAISKSSNKVKWPLEIKTNPGSVNTYILLFTEFTSYFGAGVFIIQYLSADKKESYFMATHYVEINKYGEDLHSTLFAKLSFKSISSLKEKNIFNKIKSFLNEYGIPYDINDINKHNSDTNENNPVVMYNNINKIINSHYNLMYFDLDSYINSNIDKE